MLSHRKSRIFVYTHVFDASNAMQVRMRKINSVEERISTEKKTIQKHTWIDARIQKAMEIIQVTLGIIFSFEGDEIDRIQAQMKQREQDRNKNYIHIHRDDSLRKFTNLWDG